ncbi:MAG: hypothetical protein K6T90_17765 [Leptolyngbyaceae cyanobacterium HOT.MB2.61]|nr:hypothetical protein [Leptolyngbyaceae cyanobacterium HOT.MB2.61]
MSNNNSNRLDTISTVELSDGSAERDTQEMILPRSAWRNELSYLKAVMKAKLSLDRIERAHSAIYSSSQWYYPIP